jgi:hypothetical protein
VIGIVIVGKVQVSAALADPITGTRVTMVIARSLSEAFALRSTATSLLLRKSPDLKCVNLMCAKVTMGCACRLALSLGRLECLQVLDIADNMLTVLPDSLWQPPINATLVTLDASRNRLCSLPSDVSRLRSLRRLDVRHNGLTASSVPWAELATLPSLETLLIAEGNEASCAAGAAALRSQKPTLQIQ